jgi:aminoglycoside 6'-N-acetyltransferase
MVHTRHMVALRAMQLGDLDRVEAWLKEPHVARWYLAGSSLEDEVEDLLRSVIGEQPTRALLVTLDKEPVGWCQWYRCSAYPEYAADIKAEPDDVGIDYAIGDPKQIGRGVGTTLVATLLETIREEHGRGGVVADPEATNTASRRVLEKNGFELLGLWAPASEATDAPMAIYRRPDITAMRPGGANQSGPHA